MAKFKLESTDPNILQKHIEAPTLVGALSRVLSRFSPESGGTVNIDVGIDGMTDVWDDDTDHRFRLEPEESTAFDLGGDPTSELWDAPVPGSGAQHALAMNAVDEGRAVHAIKLIERAPTEMDACNLALDALMTHIPAESGSILLAESGLLRFVCVRGPKAPELEGRTMAIDNGVAGAVLATGKPVHLRQARTHQRHNAGVDQSINHLTRTLLALPIDVAGQRRGVLELLNPFGSEVFVESHQTFAHAVTLALGDRLHRP